MLLRAEPLAQMQYMGGQSLMTLLLRTVRSGNPATAEYSAAAASWAAAKSGGTAADVRLMGASSAAVCRQRLFVRPW